MVADSPAVAVRSATSADADAIGAVQARSWLRSYQELLPAPALRQLSGPVLARAWQGALTDPPSPRHRVLVATGDGLVVGFAAIAPSGDPDAGEHDAEVVELLVDPAHQGAGHGSRLLAAATDRMRADGFVAVRVWTPTADAPRRAFLTSAGLQPDGARRTLAAPDGTRAEQVRLSAALRGD